jgi:hypothetical protein
MKRIGLASVFTLVVFISQAAVFAKVEGPLVVSDSWPECTDLMTWTDDIFRLDGVSEGSERDKAISLHNWLRLFNRLCEGVGGMAHAFEGAWGEEGFVSDAHKHLFVYGWGYCSTHALIAEALWQEYIGDPLAADRVIVMHEDGGYHTMHRLRMDGYFGAFDARYGYYLLEEDAPDARILDWDGVGDDNNIYANLTFENRCRPFFEFPQKEFERALWIKPIKVFESEAAWRTAGTEPEVVFRDRNYKMGTKFHKMDFELLRGMTIERYWDNSAKKWYVPKKNKDMFLSEGRFYRVGASMVGADGEKNDPNLDYMEPYFARVPNGVGYPAYLEGDLSLGQAWGRARYQPNLSRGDLREALLEGEGLATAKESPYLRPSADGGKGEWILEFVSPYVLVDGFIRGDLLAGEEDVAEVAFRSQVPKRLNLSQPDEWKPWKVLASKSGPFHVGLDEADSAEGSSSFHGTYRYQVRLRFKASSSSSQTGLADFGIVAFFENGIMSIPQIFSGENTVRFKVQDSARVDSDIYVTYTWESRSGREDSHTKRICPALFFKENEAVYTINAPDLWRCKSLVIEYP